MKNKFRKLSILLFKSNFSKFQLLTIPLQSDVG